MPEEEWELHELREKIALRAILTFCVIGFVCWLGVGGLIVAAMAGGACWWFLFLGELRRFGTDG